jgi:FtsP/CotA-like multicopper oxidase with cupredoxin domain
LTLHLELREALWRPEAPDGRDQAASVETPRAFDVYSFAEEGHQPQMPGPLIRVSQGTELHVSVHNLLRFAVVLYGLEQHPGNGKNVLELAPGERKEARFAAGEPGSYIYAATSAGGSAGADEQLVSGGAFIVDAPGASTADRIFVIQCSVRNEFHRSFERAFAINGKSWPYTERLHATLGHPEHWRVLNASRAIHPMHLHGFYFHVDAVGDFASERHFAEAERPMVVTETVLPFHTFDMTWTPDRPGN